MSSIKACYFYAPTWENPPYGHIRLGNVLSRVDEPQESLLEPKHLIEIDEEAVSTMRKEECVLVQDKDSGKKLSIVAKFLNVARLELGPNGNKLARQLFRCSCVETREFKPTDEYVQRCIDTPAVTRYLNRSRYRKPLFLITGIKVIQGPNKAQILAAASKGLRAGADVDATVLSGGTVALGVGAEVAGHTSVTQGFSWGNSDDFVLGYRVHRVRVHKVKVTKHYEVKSTASYTKGAMLGSGGGGDDDDAVEGDEDEDEDTSTLTFAIEPLDLGAEPDGGALREYIDGSASAEVGEYTEGDETVLCAVIQTDQGISL